MKVYYIGGSPCSGKSTIAEMIASEFSLHYYKLDDKLEEHMKMAANASKPRCMAYFEMTSEQIWMRTPEIQFDDEVEIYREIFEYAMSDIETLKVNTQVIAEGSGLMPELIKQSGVTSNTYICIVPTPEFQICNYGKRPYVPYILEGCSDKETAFANWMKRDCLFAEYSAQTASKAGYQAIWIDGAVSPDGILDFVKNKFELK
ncbi:MAG: hypothetical protein LLF87_06230 [Eubacteriales bacterium]|nr:hypothetical protein [Eubacteriales bacterium]